MNVIEWLYRNTDAGDVLSLSLIALAIWYVVWHLIISKFFRKYDFISDLMQFGPLMAPIASFGILLFFSLIAILFISSIQAALLYGAKMILVLLLFWSGIITFFILLIRHIRK